MEQYQIVIGESANKDIVIFRQYGFSVRKITFKKMSIIYLIVNHCVYIKAIIPTASIID